MKKNAARVQRRKEKKGGEEVAEGRGGAATKNNMAKEGKNKKRKADAVQSTIQWEVRPPNPKKRGRGRPKGSKNVKPGPNKGSKKHEDEVKESVQTLQ